MANQPAQTDGNNTHALIAHSGTSGTAETIKLVASAAGALTVDLVSGDTINIGTINVGTVGISGGTLNLGSVTLTTQIAGEDLTNDVLKTEGRFSYASGTGASTTVVKNAAGYIHALNILGGVMGAVTVYDNASGTSATQVLPTFTPGGGGTPYPSILIDSSVGNGIVIGLATSTIWQISYR